MKITDDYSTKICFPQANGGIHSTRQRVCPPDDRYTTCPSASFSRPLPGHRGHLAASWGALYDCTRCLCREWWNTNLCSKITYSRINLWYLLVSERAVLDSWTPDRTSHWTQLVSKQYASFSLFSLFSFPFSWTQGLKKPPSLVPSWSSGCFHSSNIKATRILDHKHSNTSLLPSIFHYCILCACAVLKATSGAKERETTKFRIQVECILYRIILQGYF